MRLIVITRRPQQADVGKESAPAKAKREDDAGRATRSGAVLTGRTRQADRVCGAALGPGL
jgi:hypothetical protein